MAPGFARSPSRVVVILHIDRLDLRTTLPHLIPGASLVVDRRRRDRRQEECSVSANRRRRRDRRRPLTDAEERSWREEGFRIVHRAGE